MCANGCAACICANDSMTILSRKFCAVTTFALLVPSYLVFIWLAMRTCACAMPALAVRNNQFLLVFALHRFRRSERVVSRFFDVGICSKACIFFSSISLNGNSKRKSLFRHFHSICLHFSFNWHLSAPALLISMPIVRCCAHTSNVRPLFNNLI